MIKAVKRTLKENIYMIIYLILSTLCTITLRLLTIGNIDSYKTILYELLVQLIICLFSHLFKENKKYKFFLINIIIINIVCIVNAIYYEWYNSFASFSLLMTIGQVGGVTEAFFAKLKITHFIYLISIIIFVITKKKYQPPKVKTNKVTILSHVSLTIIILLASLFTTETSDYSQLSNQWNREFIVSRFGIIIYQSSDLINTLKPTINSIFGYDQALKEFNDYFEENPNTQSNNKYTNIYQGYNVIYVHMESLTDFLIDLEINNTKIAPNLTNLSKEGMFFSNFYPQIGVGTSSDTEFTVLTSLLPSTNGTIFNNYYNRDYITTAKLLKEQGYYTFSMHGNKASMWNRDQAHPALGYMNFYSSTSYNLDETIGLGLSDKSFFKQSINILEQIEQDNEKYMGTMITLTNHTPFDNNEAFEQINLKYTNKNIQSDYLEYTSLGNYLRSAHYADEALGEFIQMIKDSDYFDNTLFVFYGDHAPQLSKDEYNYYYNYNFKTGEIYNEEDKEYQEFDYYDNELNKKTPLIIWTKNKKLSQKIDYYMGTIDLMPTIGNMLGIYNEYALGHDIFEIKDENIIVFPNGNFLTKEIYYKASSSTYKVLNTDYEISETYIEQNKAKATQIIKTSNNIILYNLIKNSKGR